MGQYDSTTTEDTRSGSDTMVADRAGPADSGLGLAEERPQVGSPRRGGISKCRLCGGSDLETIYSLGDQYTSGFWEPYVASTVELGAPPIGAQQEKWPLTLVYCHDCTLLQLAHNAPQEILYSRHYWYRSGTNATMYEALKDVVISTIGEYRDNRGIWLDIGANDGTLLSHVPPGFFRIGCEPARNLTQHLRYHCNAVLDDFWSAKNYYDRVNCPADIITACGMLYDLEDPNGFVRDIHDVLAPDGLLVCQLMCLEQMLENKDVGNICHEHLEYYSLATLTDLFGRHGLRIVGVEENGVNGGSYRVFVRHDSYDCPADLSAARPIPTLNDIYWFVRDIQVNRDRTVQFIKDAVAEGASIWVYGASTKGNVILQYYGLDDSLIDAAADRNPAKWGRVMAGSGIPILSEDDMRESEPDYLLCLPYGFFNEFKAREMDWYTKGGRWIVPFPEMRIV